MARVRCYRCGIETLNLTGWGKTPRCGNCDAVLPIPARGRFSAVEEGEEPGVEARLSLSSKPDPA